MFKVVQKRFLNDAKSICLFEIEAPLVAKHAQAGQFVIFRLDEQGERTPVSVAGYDREKRHRYRYGTGCRPHHQDAAHR